MRITGTFIDEITHDIPCQNWGPKEWEADFKAMQRVGIDTVIIIRSGYRDRAIFDSDVLRSRQTMMPAFGDLGNLFLDLAEQHSMKLFWGTYDPGDWFNHGEDAFAINRPFMEEVREKYGSHSAFAGWYLTFELSRNKPAQVDLVCKAAEFAKELNPDLPTLISPYVSGSKGPEGEEKITREQHEEEWRGIFKAISGKVDIVGFQDGQVDFNELPNYLQFHAKLAAECGMECWSNVEVFDRDMPIKFPPIDWRKMRYKLEAAADTGVQKLITFEFSHFMSPNSAYPAARTLYDRYCEHIGV